MVIQNEQPETSLTLWTGNIPDSVPVMFQPPLPRGAAAPQAGRILRPFCQILGLELPPELALPKRVRVREGNPSPLPSPTRGEGEEKRTGRPATPREQAEAAVRRSLATGKPIDLTKLSRVAYGYLVHPPRGGGSPPPEIGYARPRRLPRDYRPDLENCD
jgi:hypothetical protein